MEKNKHAQKLSKLRWKNTTPEQRKKHSQNMIKKREENRKAMKNMPVIEESGFVEPSNTPPTYPQF